MCGMGGVACAGIPGASHSARPCTEGSAAAHAERKGLYARSRLSTRALPGKPLSPVLAREKATRLAFRRTARPSPDELLISTPDQKYPKLTFPGGGIIGDSAGFLNVPKIKGTHTSMKSGMLAADAAFSALTSLPEGYEASSPDAVPVDMSAYEKLFEESWVAKELKEVRNVRPSFHSALGNLGGMMYSGVDTLLLKGRTPWTFHHPEEDYAATKPASEFKPIDYPAPDGVLSFDILTSVSRTGTNHAEDQPVHLHLEKANRAAHVKTNVDEYAGLLGRVCPAAVYEYVDAEGGEEDASGKRLVINSQNCIHCKTCSIKVPTQDIQWIVPEGGGGPKYSLT